MKTISKENIQFLIKSMEYNGKLYDVNIIYDGLGEESRREYSVLATEIPESHEVIMSEAEIEKLINDSIDNGEAVKYTTISDMYYYDMRKIRMAEDKDNILIED